MNGMSLNDVTKFSLCQFQFTNPLASKVNSGLGLYKQRQTKLHEFKRTTIESGSIQHHFCPAHPGGKRAIHLLAVPSMPKGRYDADGSVGIRKVAGGRGAC